jgi:hypothetical protein
MIAINQGTPVEPGIYLFQGKFSDNVEIIDVWTKEKVYMGGIEFGEYLAAHNGRSVANYLGKWSKKLKITDKGLEEA